MSQPIRQVWQFRSDSNPDKEYETLRYVDGSTSCNCPGWTRRVAADGTRSCKHTRAVDMGRADQLCSATHRYDNHRPKLQTPNAKLPTHSHAKDQTRPRLGQRRLAL